MSAAPAGPIPADPAPADPAPIGPDWPGPDSDRSAPPHRLSGAGADPALWLLDKAIGSYLWWSTGLPRRRRATRPVVPDTRQMVVLGTDLVAEDAPVLAITLGAVDGEPLAPWTPGAHVELLLPSGLRRQYSLWGEPDATDGYRIAVRLVPGGAGSTEVHAALRPGTVLPVSTPRNAFSFLPAVGPAGGGHVRLIAGGIGITAILPMARAAAAAGLDWSLIHTGRSAASLPLTDAVAALGPRARMRIDGPDGPPSASELLGPAAEPGDEPAAVYCCGPAPMLDAVHTAVGGRIDLQLHVEHFAPPVPTDGDPFTLHLARSGTAADVAGDRSTLEAMIATDPFTPYSCRQGFCRTCTVRVLDGSVDHRDQVLTDAERARGLMLPCVSRAAGPDLIIDR